MYSLHSAFIRNFEYLRIFSIFLKRETTLYYHNIEKRQVKKMSNLKHLEEFKGELNDLFS